MNLMRNIGLDLGTNWYSISKPEEVNIYKSMENISNKPILINVPIKFTIWDSIIINGPIISKNLINILKEYFDIK